MDFNEKLNSGYYMQWGDWPEKPVKPVLLSSRAESLTAEQLAELPKIKADYESAVEQQRLLRSAYHERQNEREREFHDDILAEYGMTVGDKFAERLYAIAWENGHSSGFSDVHSHFSEMADLWEVYQEALASKALG